MSEDDKINKPHHICPKCGKPLKSLELSYRVTITTAYYLYNPDSDDPAVISDAEEEGDDVSNEEWRCPECYEVLALNEKHAILLLRGLTKEQEHAAVKFMEKKLYE
jgi:ribosomal protein S27AE